MNKKLDSFRKVKDFCSSFPDFNLYDYLYYVGISNAGIKLKECDILNLMNIAESVCGDHTDPIVVSQALAEIVFVKKYMSIEELKKIPSEDIYDFYYNDKLHLLEKYLGEKYKDKLEEFDQLCGDWDYRNIDMTDSHLSGIEIVNNNIIGLFCERYDTTLDEYISCSGGNISNKKLVEEFISLDLENEEDVRNFMSEIDNYIDWDKVNELLDNELKKALEKEEMEMEI